MPEAIYRKRSSIDVDRNVENATRDVEVAYDSDFLNPLCDFSGSILDIQPDGYEWVKCRQSAEVLPVILPTPDDVAASNHVFIINLPQPTLWRAFKLFQARTSLSCPSPIHIQKAPADQWAVLAADLEKWGQLPDDWDGDGARAPSQLVVANAKALLGRLRRAALSAPESYIAVDGEIGFTWRQGDRYASAALLADGHLVGYCDSDPPKVFRIDEPFHRDLDLSDFFTRLRRIT